MKNCSNITRVILPCLAISAVALFGASTAWAQASGANFTASVDNTVCTINSTSNSGILAGNFVPGATGGSLSAQIKLPGSLPGLLVTPSLVTGMYTNTLSANNMTSETAAIVVVVTDTVNGNTVTLTPNQTCVVTNDISGARQCGVAYDERFQQLNTVLGTNESVQLILSTLSAHAFDFTEGNVPSGIHTVKVNWYFGCDNGSGTLRTSQCATAFAPNSAAACAGPGTLTVTQVQQFQHSSQIGTTGP